MDHTDAGAHVGLADARLPENTFAGDGEIPPVAFRPRAPEIALVSLDRGQRRRDHPFAAPGEDQAGQATGALADVVDLGFPELLPEPMEWQERALCAQTDPEAFFPEKGGSTREAKRICAGCEVRPECLEYALANDERFGIWGGMSERERRRQRRRAV
jgi:hypothetical protein